MSSSLKRNPDRCPTHPGAFLREIVFPSMSASKTELARALGISRQSLYELLAEKQPVTPMMAVRLGTVLNTTAVSWLNMQSSFDIWHAERQLDRSKLKQLNLPA